LYATKETTLQVKTTELFLQRTISLKPVEDI